MLIYMKKILFYGNCQCGALKDIIIFPKKFNKVFIPCFLTKLNKNNFTNLIKNFDIIITQPISDNYRNKFYLSTKYLLNNCNKKCIIIIFDSCYFHFYYPDLTYIKFNNSTNYLQKPIDYHYKHMIYSYKNNLSISDYINNYVNNINLYSIDELNNMATISLNDLYSRYLFSINNYKLNDNIHIFTSHDFIKDNYKNILLFYSMNHPTKHLLYFISNNISNILLKYNIIININYNIDVLSDPKCIIYKCIQNVVNFNIDEHLPFSHKINKSTDLNIITNSYYNIYKNTDFNNIVV